MARFRRIDRKRKNAAYPQPLSPASAFYLASRRSTFLRLLPTPLTALFTASALRPVLRAS